MNIKNQFNKFYHSRILTDLFNKSSKLLFRHLLDTRTNGAFIIYKYEDYSDVDELKQLLKVLNLDYQVDEDNDCKISTSNIDSRSLVNHIEWVLKIAAENAIELDLVKEEWEQLTQNYEGY